jgi:hypothetical protein
MSWSSATKPQGIAGVGSRPRVSMCVETMHAQKQTHTLAAAAFAAAVKPGAGNAAVYATGVSINRVERPEGPRGRAG